MTIPQIRKQQLSDLELIFASRRLRRRWAGLDIYAGCVHFCVAMNRFSIIALDVWTRGPLRNACLAQVEQRDCQEHSKHRNRDAG